MNSAKTLISIILYLFLTSMVYADVSKNVSEYVSNLIPGNGHTEVSIDLRENNKPDYSILGVREILELDSGNIFTQFSLFNTEQNNSERIIGNLGIGSRKLLNNDTLIIGMNAFIDQDFNESHKRGSFGFEVRNSVLDFNGNMYRSLQDTTKEIILDGWDYRLAGQVPYVHWSKLFINGYEWDGVLREDIKGMKIGSEMVLTPISILELAYDDKDKKGLEDEWYAKIQFIYPPKNNGPTALDGISDLAWKESKDMSGELLSKVQRNNKIMIEFKGSSTISRTD
ncbi:inverse autotransporter beta domain-containing protein [Pelagibacterales bacterium SAG-MED12]|nr:inverse autotransporter beta domain-containing protein [Pelagibacterales bacterium SAG-MED12]